MLVSMAYLDQILPISSTVEAVEVTRRASMWSWFATSFSETVNTRASYVGVRTRTRDVYTHAGISRVRAYVFLVTRMIHRGRRGFSTSVLFIILRVKVYDITCMQNPYMENSNFCEYNYIIIHAYVCMGM